jgi:hypothetical protein
MEQQAATTALQYGVLGIVTLAFAFAIIQLFKMMRADQAVAKVDAVTMEKERGQWGVERGKWSVEREALRAEYERKHRELAESYTKIASEGRDASRAHEDLVRKDFADLMERVAREVGTRAVITEPAGKTAPG